MNCSTVLPRTGVHMNACTVYVDLESGALHDYVWGAVVVKVVASYIGRRSSM